MSAELPRFAPGARVRVRADGARGHVRTPGYVRGRTGRVVRVHGSFRNPESLAYGGDGLPLRPLYQVCFEQPQLWPGYAAPAVDRLCVDIYEHWLDPAPPRPPSPAESEDRAAATGRPRGSPGEAA